MTVLHYWETWCCPEADIETLAKIQEKYKEDLTIVGCNIESLQVGAGDLESKQEAATEKFRDFVRANRGKMTWVQLHEPGGVDASPLAHKLGVSLEPLVVLIDAEGKLVEANIAVSDLEREIERTRRKK